MDHPNTRPPARNKRLPLRPAAGRLVRGLLATYLGIVLIMSFLERRLVYPAPALTRSDWSPAQSSEPTAPHEVWIASDDGVEVHGWFYERPDAGHAVLYCHGNAEQVADNDTLMRRVRKELNADVLIFDYRGYGKTRGRADHPAPPPTERGVIADGLAAQHWLAEKTGRSPDEIVLIGRSLGGGVATALAAKAGAGALLLQDTFTRLPDVAANRYPWLPVSLVMQNRYDSLAGLSRYRGPLLVSHGNKDRVVPFSHAQQLYNACPSPQKRYLPQPTRGHDDPLPTSYWEAVRELLAPPREGARIRHKPAEFREKG
ncbi:alpha/beta hydrolase [Botrimarina hoheduenensis]|uniref:Alpha/beta hydrolase family protein n=1 Tax=Botrimarina hoheduenensis TaxID=2528000 RepID=A0A5C5WE99_9BACT|nr:alpha/beta hydrolase [Botrimarina hoheduenensis]TWT48375.1 Alpha/beta hydrolase family protein [Botrimarina hoheduenensis]